jgi:hypothetical protein
MPLDILPSDSQRPHDVTRAACCLFYLSFLSLSYLHCPPCVAFLRLPLFGYRSFVPIIQASGTVHLSGTSSSGGLTRPALPFGGFTR